MCWTTSTGGTASPEIFPRRADREAGPPVDPPTARREGKSRDRMPDEGTSGSRQTGSGTLIPDSSRTFRRTDARKSGLVSMSAGFSRISWAPFKRASTAVRDPRWVCPLTTRIRAEKSVRIRSASNSPPMPGISISSVTTSGDNAPRRESASSADSASPTTAISGDRENISLSAFRKVRESSTTRTRVIAGGQVRFMAVWYPVWTAPDCCRSWMS